MQQATSDVSLGKRARAVFYCDGSVVAVQFFDCAKAVGETIVHTRKEAIEIGQRVAETGIYERLPITGIDIIDVKGFGVVLRRYGEEGR